MNYASTLAYIMNQLPMYQRIGKLAYRAGLDNTHRMDEHFDHPHKHFKTVHVAGTNGKGSVSHMLASILQESGMTVGLYTSPHLTDFRERIRINGKLITKKFISHFISENKSFFSSFNPSFFEISVFMAFEYFRQNKVDIAVIEVGLGGRLDATNVITPVLSVITNIGKDHTEILGDTTEKIAAEKAGIIKQHIPVVIGESQAETMTVFRSFSERLHAPVIVADQLYRIDYSLVSVDDYQVFNVRKNDEIYYTNLKCALLGHYQRKNTATVLAAIDFLGNCLSGSGIVNPFPVSIKQKDLYKGIRNVIANTGLSGRWQVTGHNPLIVCDTAHNADGIRMVLQQVSETNYRKLFLIIGFVNDKDIHEILKFFPAKAEYGYVRLSVPRTLDENDLASAATQFGLKGTSFENVGDAFQMVIKKAQKDDLVVITGSNFLVADFLNYCKPR